jgi:hypothetical protein
MRYLLPLAWAAALAACAPTVPDSGAGVGFGDYESFLRQQEAERRAREAQLTGQVTVLPPERTGAPPATGEGPITEGELAAAGIGGGPAGAPSGVPASPVEAPLPQGRSPTYLPLGGQAGAAPATPPSGSGETITPAPGAPDPLAGRAPVISDEQSFTAVTSRETIDSDRERLERQRALRQQVTPAPLPERPADTGPDIVAYALRTTNAVGQPLYSRAFGSPSRAARACARYASPDIAQRAFLAEGGPERDRLGLDPDGDGFACGWNPQPFRTAVRG